MNRPEVGKISGQRYEMSRVLRLVELQEPVRGAAVVMVARPAEFSESLLEFSVGADRSSNK